MSIQYNAEYTSKPYHRTQLIEWIKGLLADSSVPHTQRIDLLEDHSDGARNDVLALMSATAHPEYGRLLSCEVQSMINNHIEIRKTCSALTGSALLFLLPCVEGMFFSTPWKLADAFEYQDRIRRISSRRFVLPSFDDVRVVLNSAQLLGLVGGGLELITFDGDVTFHDDGESLTADNPVIPRILDLLARGTKIGIMMAAGYREAKRYYGRLSGLLEAIKSAVTTQQVTDPELIILGGESNFLFRFDATSTHLLQYVRRSEWLLPEMWKWTEEDIKALLDVAEKALRECISTMDLSGQIIRKERAVGLIPTTAANGQKFSREQLEETVIMTQLVVEMSPVAKRLPFCAFNRGNNVFVDIGDKGWGILACQRYLGGIECSKTLHVGDLFRSAGANDFKVRFACATAWIANPGETVELLDELTFHSQG